MIAHKLRPHQEEAVHATTTAFDTTDRVQVIMACGTGKTLVGIATAERRGAQRIVVFVPSLSLIAQTLTSWRGETQVPLSDILCVCSDTSLGVEDEDAPVVELPLAITTNADVVRQFAQSHRDRCLVLVTYHSAGLLAEGLPAAYPFDLGIFDEAHRTAGPVGKRFAFALEDRGTLAISKRLFLTATQRFMDGRWRQHAYSMDDDAVYGPVAYRLPLAEAIRRGLICPYRVVISVTTDPQADALPQESPAERANEDGVTLLAQAVELGKAMRETGARHAFTFHRRVVDATRFAATFGEVEDRAGHAVYSQHVHSLMAHAQRARTLAQFAASPSAVISNARCLSEGVDLPAVDMVAFMASRSSTIDVVQIVGRALRNSPGKTWGHVFLPIRVRTAAGETVESSLTRTEMASVWQVLQAIHELDERAGSQIDEAQVAMARSGQRAAIGWLDDIDIHAPPELLGYLRRHIDVMMLEALGDPWLVYFGHLCKFYDAHGHLRLPVGFQAAGIDLSAWCSKQLSAAREGTLRPDRRDRFARAGFLDLMTPAEVRDAKWAASLEQLCKYRDAHGHTRMPKRYQAGGVDLSAWWLTQRQCARKGTLRPERRGQLIALNFDLPTPSPSRADAWEARFAELQAFFNQHGHSNVPLNAGHDGLAGWCRAQRQHAAAGKLDPARVARLEALGFQAEGPLAQRWEALYQELKEFQQADRSAPKKRKALVLWCTMQRTFYATGRYDNAVGRERVAKLRAIGFKFDRYSPSRRKALVQTDRAATETALDGLPA